MSNTRTPIYKQDIRKDNASTNTSSTTLVNDNAKSKTSTQAQSKQPSSDYQTSSNTTSDEQPETISTMSSTASTRSPASSTRGGSSIDSGKRPLIADPSKSSVERAMDKAKNKLGRSTRGTESLPNDELDFERQRAKTLEKQQRKEEYERLGLSEKTKYGSGGFSFSG